MIATPTAPLMIPCRSVVRTQMPSAIVTTSRKSPLASMTQ